MCICSYNSAHMSNYYVLLLNWSFARPYKLLLIWYAEWPSNLSLSSSQWYQYAISQVFYENVFYKNIHICRQITISRKTEHESDGDKEKHMENVEREKREICCNYIIIKNKKYKTLTNQLPSHSYIQYTLSHWFYHIIQQLFFSGDI